MGFFSDEKIIVEKSVSQNESKEKKKEKRVLRRIEIKLYFIRNFQEIFGDEISLGKKIKILKCILV